MTNALTLCGSFGIDFIMYEAINYNSISSVINQSLARSILK